MKASQLVELLTRAISDRGDFRIVIGYDGSHADIDPGPGDADDGFGPRHLNVAEGHNWDGSLSGEKVFEL